MGSASSRHDVLVGNDSEWRDRKIRRVEVSDNRLHRAQPLDGAATDEDIVVLVGGIALRLAQTGVHVAFRAPLTGIGLGPAGTRQAMRAAEELVKAPVFTPVPNA